MQRISADYLHNGIMGHVEIDDTGILYWVHRTGITKLPLTADIYRFVDAGMIITKGGKIPLFVRDDTTNQSLYCCDDNLNRRAVPSDLFRTHEESLRLGLPASEKRQWDPIYQCGWCGRIQVESGFQTKETTPKNLFSDFLSQLKQKG